jgi:UDP-glucose 4-epimerase
MNILVTGGLGYIGSHTVVKLIQEGHNPIIVDNLSNSSIDVLDRIKTITGKEVDYHIIDLSIKPIDDILTSIDCIIHFAAFKSVSESVREPIRYFDNNITSTIKLLQSAQNMGVKKFIFSSSCTVYGEPDKYPVNEDTPIKPAKCPYGMTKQVCEEILHEVSKTGLNVVILRYFNPIGAHSSGLLYDNPKGIPENLIPYITGVIDGKYPKLRVFGNDYNTHDGTAIRDYIDINDLADAHVKAINVTEKENYSVINVGSGNGYSVMDILEAFKRNGHEIPYDIYPRRDGDIEKIYSDISKAKDVMGWEPTNTIDDSVKAIINTLY